MRRFASRFFGRGVVGAVALGTTFQIGSCTIDENGVLSVFADPLALIELGGEIFEDSPFLDLFDDDFGGHGGPGRHSEHGGPCGLGPLVLCR